MSLTGSPSSAVGPLGLATDRPALGIGWRPEVAGVAADRPDIAFVEVVAESVPEDGHPLPLGLTELVERGVPVFTHGIGLSLGSADRPSADHVASLAAAAIRMQSPIVSEHLAFVRAGGRSAGHLLAVPRTREMVAVLAENIRIAEDQLPVPLAVESPASLIDWPDEELDEADFVTEVIARSGAGLLLDLANLYVNARNRGADPFAVLERMPLEQLAYVHVAGGHEQFGVFHDTHAAPVWDDVLELTRHLVARVPDARVMLERDDRFGTAADLDDELDAIAAAMGAGFRAGAGAGAGAGSGLRAVGDGQVQVVAAAGPTTKVRPSVRVDRSAPFPASAGARTRLAAGQVRLLAALTESQSAPARFDTERVALTREALVAKRTREVALRWPATAAWIGADFAGRFEAYAARRPVPVRGGPTADGASFIAGLGRRDGDDAARAEWRRARVGPTRRWRRRW